MTASPGAVIESPQSFGTGTWARRQSTAPRRDARPSATCGQRGDLLAAVDRPPGAEVIPGEDWSAPAAIGSASAGSGLVLLNHARRDTPPGADRDALVFRPC